MDDLIQVFWYINWFVQEYVKFSLTWRYVVDSTRIYLLLAECEVRTASYGPSFFPSFYGSSAKSARHENKEGKNEDP